MSLYEYKMRRLETFAKAISNASSNSLDCKVHLGNHEIWFRIHLNDLLSVESMIPNTR